MRRLQRRHPLPNRTRLSNPRIPFTVLLSSKNPQSLNHSPHLSLLPRPAVARRESVRKKMNGPLLTLPRPQMTKRIAINQREVARNNSLPCFSAQWHLPDPCQLWMIRSPWEARLAQGLQRRVQQRPCLHRRRRPCRAASTTKNLQLHLLPHSRLCRRQALHRHLRLHHRRECQVHHQHPRHPQLGCRVASRVESRI